MFTKINNNNNNNTKAKTNISYKVEVSRSARSNRSENFH